MPVLPWAIVQNELRESRRAFWPLRQDVLCDCLSRSGSIICVFWYHSPVCGRQMVGHFDSCFVLDERVTALDTPEQPVGLIDVPCDADVRKLLRTRASSVDWQRFSAPIQRSTLANLADQLLREERLPAGFRSWLMVILASNYWREAVTSVPFQRRLLLLPDFSDPAVVADDLNRRSSEFERLRPMAERLGYQIAYTNHLSCISQSIRAGEIDAVLGVSDLRGLEKAVDQVLAWGIPCMAEPLLEDSHDSVDQESVERMIHLPFTPNGTEAPGGYHRVMQAARELFRIENLTNLMPQETPTFFHAGIGAPADVAPKSLTNGQLRTPPNSFDPLTGTATIAYDFLSRGGKYFRPFITLATYNALTQNRGNGKRCSAESDAWSAGVKRTAMAIEVFHKASLIHDDIEDDDDFRYGEPSVHKRYGTATAINVGDYLVGLGYRMVSGCKQELGGETVADLLDCLACAHQRLSEGQGAELLWLDAPNKSLTPAEALKVYALKTAPAFEVAFYSGLRLAGPVHEEVELVRAFSEHLGVAFQILNDLKDWCEDQTNKGAPGGDILHGRPTLLWALALQAANPEQRTELLSLVERTPNDPAPARLEQVRRLYERLGVFHEASDTVRRLEEAAWLMIARLQPAALRNLFGYLMRVVLHRPQGLDRVLQNSGENA